MGLTNAKVVGSDFKSFMDINISNAIARQFAFDTYLKIMKRKDKCDLSKDEKFQKLFNGYYRIRRNKKWRKSFYDYFESIKDKNDIDFNIIIEELYTRTGNVEASFSSKMLATINPEMPILDSQVLTNLNLKIKGQGDKKRENAKGVYSEICLRYSNYKNTSNYEKAIAIFDGLFPKYSNELTDIKKIDFFLWALTRKELDNMGVFDELINSDNN